MSIVVVGSINSDLTIQVPHFAMAHETVLGNGNFVITQGGKGANQAVAAAAGGLAVHMVGKIGNDDFGKAAVSELETFGIDCTQVTCSPDGSTGIAAIFVDPEGNNSITVASGANAQITSGDIVAATELIAQASVVMLQLEIPLAAVETTIEIANKCGTLVIFDPAPATQTLPCLSGVDYITPNEVEAQTMVQIAADSENGPKRIIAAFQGHGVKNVALTLGRRGCYLAEGDKTYQLAARQVQAVDSTGAGDTFNGFLATGLAKGMSLEAAAKVACAAATLSVTKPGARGGLPSWEQASDYQ